jgi:hypothetical protein
MEFEIRKTKQYLGRNGRQLRLGELGTAGLEIHVPEEWQKALKIPESIVKKYHVKDQLYFSNNGAPSLLCEDKSAIVIGGYQGPPYRYPPLPLQPQYTESKYPVEMTEDEELLEWSKAMQEAFHDWLHEDIILREHHAQMIPINCDGPIEQRCAPDSVFFCHEDELMDLQPTLGDLNRFFATHHPTDALKKLADLKPKPPEPKTDMYGFKKDLVTLTAAPKGMFGVTSATVGTVMAKTEPKHTEADKEVDPATAADFMAKIHLKFPPKGGGPKPDGPASGK